MRLTKKRQAKRNGSACYSLVTVLEVVAAATPDPVTPQVTWSARPGAAARGQGAVSARPGHRVHHARGADGVCERGLSAG